MAAFGANAVSLDWDLTHTSGSVDGEIESFDSVGLIRLEVIAGVTYNLFATTFGYYSNDATIRVYDANGTQLQYTGLSGYTSVLVYTATASGTVYVGVGNISGSPGPYDFFVSTYGGTNKILGYDDNAYTGLANERILAGNGNDTITLGAATEAFGSGGNDYIRGNDVGNRIAGGAGNDYISLGNGNNTAWGNSGVDQIFGANGIDLIFGGDDTDRLYGNGNNDTIRGGNGADLIYGGSGSDRLYGEAGNDRIIAEDGDDLIVGGTGTDHLTGGLGDDRFYIDNVGDQVFEAADQGNDAVFSSVTYTLAAGQQIETLATTQVAGISAVNLAGNEFAQRINGNNGINVLSGLAGNDVLVGYGGNDRLNGGIGADQMSGGLGNDSFYVDNAGDKVFEAAAQGTDTVYSSVSYALSAGQHVETLTTMSLTGTGAINLTGNELAQRISGNNGVNILSGAAGNDVLAGYGGNDLLRGGTGNDTLVGGIGSDYFMFDTALNPITNVDTITDFNVAADTIRLDNAVMAGLGVTLGTLSAAKFWKNTTGLAHDADDRIIYETDTGKLFYDSNGIAAGGAVQIAKLAPNLALTNADFVVI